MEIEGKVWGETSLIFSKNNVEVHRIVGKLYGFSSKHKHEKKFNMFFVESGTLKISIWKDYGLLDETILEKGQSTVVPPGLFHQFNVIDGGTIAYEFYWTEIESNDIIRENVGGRK